MPENKDIQTESFKEGTKEYVVAYSTQVQKDLLEEQKQTNRNLRRLHVILFCILLLMLTAGVVLGSVYLKLHSQHVLNQLLSRGV